MSGINMAESVVDGGKLVWQRYQRKQHMAATDGDSSLERGKVVKQRGNVG